MENNTIFLLLSTGLTSFALLFTIISVAAPGWGYGNLKIALFKCPNGGPCSQLSGAGVLLIIGIIFLAISIVLLLLIARGAINSPTSQLKTLLTIFIFLAAIFIIGGYSRAIAGTDFYSYHLAVTAGILTFLSGMIVSYWSGRS